MAHNSINLSPSKNKKHTKNTQFPRFWETRAKGKLNISNETKEGKLLGY